MVEIRDATWDDFDSVVELLDARSRAVFGISEVQPEHIRQRWELPGFDLGWVAESEGSLVGYASLDATQEPTIAAGDPDVAGAPARAGAVTRPRARLRPRRADRRPCGCGGLEARRAERLRARPRDPPHVAAARRRPAGRRRGPTASVVRTYTDADGSAVHAMLDEAYAGWDRDYVAREHDAWVTVMTDHSDFDPSVWFLVERDGELVACALHWKVHRRRGWVKDIVVRESERGHGLGKALLHHAFRAYADQGATSVGLKVDSTNPTGAPQLYERVGFVTDQRYGIWMKRL